MSSNIKRVRLCCDGCPGKNKNTVMIGMIIEKHSAVFHLREGYEIFDWKSYLKTILRNNVSWHFKIASCKRIVVLKRPRIIEVRGEPFYTVEVNAFKSLTKKGKNFNSINLPIHSFTN